MLKTKLKITEATNFLRLFILPSNYPGGYCFDGPKPVVFRMVDWFNPFGGGSVVSKELTLEELKEKQNETREFISSKKYFDTSNVYLAVTDYGDAFIINPEKITEPLEAQLKAIKKEQTDGKEKG